MRHVVEEHALAEQANATTNQACVVRHRGIGRQGGLGRVVLGRHQRVVTPFEPLHLTWAFAFLDERSLELAHGLLAFRSFLQDSFDRGRVQVLLTRMERVTGTLVPCEHFVEENSARFVDEVLVVQSPVRCLRVVDADGVQGRRADTCRGRDSRHHCSDARTYLGKSVRLSILADLLVLLELLQHLRVSQLRGVYLLHRIRQTLDLIPVLERTVLSIGSTLGELCSQDLALVLLQQMKDVIRCLYFLVFFRHGYGDYSTSRTYRSLPYKSRSVIHCGS